jgi:hypothetical protein
MINLCTFLSLGAAVCYNSVPPNFIDCYFKNNTGSSYGNDIYSFSLTSSLYDIENDFKLIKNTCSISLSPKFIDYTEERSDLFISCFYVSSLDSSDDSNICSINFPFFYYYCFFFHLLLVVQQYNI